MEPIQGKLSTSQFDFGYTEQFCIPGVTSVFSCLVTVLLGTLWSSIKQIEAPYLFDWEHGIALNTKPGNRASSLRGRSLMGFLELRQEPGVYSRVTAGMAI